MTHPQIPLTPSKRSIRHRHLRGKKKIGWNTDHYTNEDVVFELPYLPMSIDIGVRELNARTRERVPWLQASFTEDSCVTGTHRRSLKAECQVGK